MDERTATRPRRALGIHGRFYRDTNNGEIYRYIADGSLVQNRQLVAICLKVRASSLSMVIGSSFINLFVLATQDQIDSALLEAQQLAARRQPAQQIDRSMASHIN